MTNVSKLVWSVMDENVDNEVYNLLTNNNNNNDRLTAFDLGQPG